MNQVDDYEAEKKIHFIAPKNSIEQVHPLSMMRYRASYSLAFS
jgi:hypothetical protein